jgi:hypothetical protein
MPKSRNSDARSTKNKKPSSEQVKSFEKKVDDIIDPAIIDEKMVDSDTPVVEEAGGGLGLEEEINEDEEELDSLGEHWDE